jgi:hypothetical protein
MASRGGVPVSLYRDLTRVVVFLDNATGPAVLLDKLRVTDGDGPPPGDWFPDDGSFLQGWAMDGFRYFWDFICEESVWLNSLISGYGDIEIVNSKLVGVPGLRRAHSDYRAQAITVDSNYDPPTLAGATKGGGILVWGGSLTVRDSEIRWLPIIATDVFVSISGSSISGDHSLVTMTYPFGEINDTDFVLEIVEGAINSEYMPSTLWELSLEGTWISQPFEIRGCSFTGLTGSGVGVNLNYAFARIEGCTFADLELGIWDHESNVAANWRLLNETNVFEASCSFSYMDTRTMTLLYTGEDVDPQRWDERGSWRYQTNYEIEPSPPGQFYLYETPTRAIVALPRVLADPTRGDWIVDTVTLSLKSPGGTRHKVPISTDKISHVINFEGQSTVPSWNRDYYVSQSIHSVNASDELTVTIQFLVGRNTFLFPSIYFYLDGVLHEHVDLDNDWGGTVTRNFTIPSGLSDLEISCMALHEDLGQTLELRKTEVGIYRASYPSDNHDALSIMDYDESILVVDQNLTLDGVNWTFADGNRYEYHLTICAYNGSRVTMDELVLPEDGYLTLTTLGGGEITLSGGVIFQMLHESRGASFTIRDSEIGLLEAYSTSNEYSFVDTDGPDILCFDKGTGNLTLDGVVATDIWDMYYIVSYWGNITIKNCSFSPMEGTIQSFWIYPSANVTVDVDGCKFDSMNLSIYPQEATVSFNITGCSFDGPDATLSIFGPGWFQ